MHGLERTVHRGARARSATPYLAGCGSGAGPRHPRARVRRVGSCPSRDVPILLLLGEKSRARAWRPEAICDGYEPRFVVVDEELHREQLVVLGGGTVGVDAVTVLRKRPCQLSRRCEDRHWEPPAGQTVDAKPRISEKEHLERSSAPRLDDVEVAPDLKRFALARAEVREQERTRPILRRVRAVHGLTRPGAVSPSGSRARSGRSPR